MTKETFDRRIIPAITFREVDCVTPIFFRKY